MNTCLCLYSAVHQAITYKNPTQEVSTVCGTLQQKPRDSKLCLNTNHGIIQFHFRKESNLLLDQSTLVPKKNFRPSENIWMRILRKDSSENPFHPLDTLFS